ncbi:MAG: transglutaminase-like domain-containing protein [Roseateles sp.]|uniref:transglutaminase-like domain-containing protein n=1 Tax=Roseateles sp. TaxID=1971397 RepID=UPI004035AE05
MIRIELQLQLKYEVSAPGADFIFNIHPAYTSCQTVSAERLHINQDIRSEVQTDATTGNRHLRLQAQPGDLEIRYEATVDLVHHRMQPADLQEVPILSLPLDVLRYIYPSRYCQSDRLARLALAEFGAVTPGHQRVLAIIEWIQQRVSFTSNTSTSSTSAVDTLIERTGVCRDFTHLLVALCRALNIPARFTTGTDYGADPVLGPPDFHAYAEVYLGDRWYIFDPSGTAIPMGFVRFGTGRDAADVAFATIFGPVTPWAPWIQTIAQEDAAAGLVLPHHCDLALSTDGGAGA